MEVTNASLDWTPDDAVHFRDFLETQSGARLIPKLAESAPRLLPGGQTNDIITRAGELLGFQQAVQALLELTNIPQADPRPINAFPDLDDASQWPEEKK